MGTKLHAARPATVNFRDADEYAFKAVSPFGDIAQEYPDDTDTVFKLLDNLGIEYKQQTPQQDRLIDALVSALPFLSGPFEKELEDKFEQLGDLSSNVFLRNSSLILSHNPDGSLGFAPDKLSDAVAQIRASDWAKDELEPIFENHTERVANHTVRTVNEVMDIRINVPDHVMRQLIADGGLRLGLVDIEGDTRKSIFRALHEGRSAGEGADPLARRIRSEVPAGRFHKAGPAYRSKLIARTETKWAQNTSSLVAYENSADITKVVAYDAQLGASRSDPDCIARNGREFLIKDAKVELSKEHPNGTLSFAPIVNPGARDAQAKPTTEEDARAHHDFQLPKSMKPGARNRNLVERPPRPRAARGALRPRPNTNFVIDEAEIRRVRRRALGDLEQAPKYRAAPINGAEARARLNDVHEVYARAMVNLSEEIDDIKAQLSRAWWEKWDELIPKVSSDAYTRVEKDALWEDFFGWFWDVHHKEILKLDELYNLLDNITNGRRNAFVEAIEHRLSSGGARPNYQLASKEEIIWEFDQGWFVPTGIEDVPINWQDIEHLDNAATNFGRLVRDWPDQNKTIEFHITPTRAYQTGIGDGNSAIYYSGRTDIYGLGDTTSTVIHEMGHALSTANNDILQDAVDFLYGRVGNDKLEQMRKLTGLAYDRSEVTRPDLFYNPYVGKEYSARAKLWKKFFGEDSLLSETVLSPWNKKDIIFGEEVVSMGLESMFADAWEFAQLDVGHFDFIFDRVMNRGLQAELEGYDRIDTRLAYTHYLNFLTPLGNLSGVTLNASTLEEALASLAIIKKDADSTMVRLAIQLKRLDDLIFGGVSDEIRPKLMVQRARYASTVDLIKEELARRYRSVLAHGGTGTTLKWDISARGGYQDDYTNHHQIVGDSLDMFNQLIQYQAQNPDYKLEFNLGSYNAAVFPYKQNVLEVMPGLSLFRTNTDGTKTLDDYMRYIMVHEYTHALEWLHSDILEDTLQYYDERTTDRFYELNSDTDIDVSQDFDIFVRNGYEDDFPRQYAERIYQGTMEQWAGEYWGGGWLATLPTEENLQDTFHFVESPKGDGMLVMGHEMTSMAIQWMASDAGSFAEEDPELFAFIFKHVMRRNDYGEYGD